MWRPVVLAVLLLAWARVQSAAGADGGGNDDEEIALAAEENDDPMLVEGDMIAEYSRSGLKSESKHWPGGKVYYTVSSAYNEKQRDVIAKAMRHIESKSCIRFIERTNQKNYIRINNDRSGCFSHVGLVTAMTQPQSVNLGKNCLYNMGAPVHEMLHTLGFYHEQSRVDRDKYVIVNWENIKDKSKSNFNKQTAARVTDSGTSYDYGSIMHYGRMAFNKNKKPTLVARNGATIGQRKGLSDTDFAELNKLYKCGSRGMRLS